ncbi:hypothetical protein ABZT08_13430 [Streptomyces sp. NPDC005526]|uniref:VOC family protein n=1 Tax=Streptomyces sp. NPDC005526 TaxID=3156885 RepID=UPI0033B51D2C
MSSHTVTVAGHRAAASRLITATRERAESDPPPVSALGPASGIQAKPGLTWATCNFAVADLRRTRSDLHKLGCETSAIEGAPEICLFFTLHDPDGNTLLTTDR